MAVDYDALDPGIREIVRLLNTAGFETSDSGDGVSKPADWYASGEAMPFPHVVAATTPTTMVEDADRLAALLGPTWNVEAAYQTLTTQAHLLARTLDDRETKAGADASPRQQEGWQPITDDQKTGHRLLVAPVAGFCEESSGVGYWDRDEEDENGQCWRGEDNERIEPPPTHFQRLPAPPAASKGSKKDT